MYRDKFDVFKNYEADQMIKKITYILLPMCMSLSVAVADSLPSGAVLLSAEQMDQVSAGLGAIVNISASANSSVFATTHTNAIALTAVSNINNPALGGFVEVAGGGASAIAAGTGAVSSTNVSPATSMQGSPGTLTYQSGGSFHGSLVNITASVILTAGSIFANPF
jgi:hypothetical protein